MDHSRRFHRRLHILLLVLVIGVGSLVSATPVSAQVGCSPYYIVRQGDNLFRIGLAYNVAWPYLARYNGIANPARIYPGQVICIPPGAPATPPVVVPPPPPPTGGIYYPPPGVYPRIDFNTRSAGPGDTIVITGVNFPGNATVDIFIAPIRTSYPAVPSASAVVAPDGTLATNFTVPAEAGGVPLSGWALSVLVRARGSGYYAYNYFLNTRP